MRGGARRGRRRRSCWPPCAGSSINRGIRRIDRRDMGRSSACFGCCKSSNMDVHVFCSSGYREPKPRWRPMDSLNALSVFVRAAETRSFTDAGRRLSVSSSAVGKTISRLEDRLGVRLFHRNTRSITLTPEGELFLESCRRIFSEISKIEVEFSQSKATPKGRFKVSLPDVGTLMMPTLHGFMREYPEIQVDAEFTDNLIDVVEGGYDAVIRTGAQTDSRLMSRRLGSYRLEIVGAPSYFARHGMPATPNDLAAH